MTILSWVNHSRTFLINETACNSLFSFKTVPNRNIWIVHSSTQRRRGDSMLRWCVRRLQANTNNIVILSRINYRKTVNWSLPEGLERRRRLRRQWKWRRTGTVESYKLEEKEEVVDEVSKQEHREWRHRTEPWPCRPSLPLVWRSNNLPPPLLDFSSKPRIKWRFSSELNLKTNFNRFPLSSRFEFALLPTTRHLVHAELNRKCFRVGVSPSRCFPISSINPKMRWEHHHSSLNVFFFFSFSFFFFIFLFFGGKLLLEIFIFITKLVLTFL